MGPLGESIEVDRPPETVFAYVTDPARFGEWQENVTGGHLDTDGPAAAGDTCRTVRQIGFAQRPVTSVITAIDPPKRWSVRGTDGPIRAHVDVSVRPLDGGRRSALTVEIAFEGHGVGKLLVPLFVTRGGAKEMPRNLGRLKANIESAPG